MCSLLCQGELEKNVSNTYPKKVPKITAFLCKRECQPQNCEVLKYALLIISVTILIGMSWDSYYYGFPDNQKIELREYNFLIIL